MTFLMEDEVDWSDGSLGAPSPTLRPSNDTIFGGKSDQSPEQAPLFEPEDHESWDLPFGEPLPLGMLVS